VLEDENAKLNKLLAEAMLDNATLKDVVASWWGPVGPLMGYFVVLKFQMFNGQRPIVRSHFFIVLF
jgi:hypothetical protein